MRIRGRAAAVSIIMGLYSLVGMRQVMTNVTGDAVVTTIIAKWEKALNIEEFGKECVIPGNIRRCGSGFRKTALKSALQFQNCSAYFFSIVFD